MNAKMRIGHFTATRHSRLRVNMAGLRTALTTGIFVFAATQSVAGGPSGYDTNLERWAKQRLAERIGEIRDSYDTTETLRMVTEIDVKRGPLPLGADRQNDPIWVMATLRFGAEINVAGPFESPAVVVETMAANTPYPPRDTYTGALVLAKN